MDERDLESLAHEPAGPAESPRPLGAVLRRSHRLRRRRRTLRALGASALVAGLFGATTLAQRDRDPDLATAPPPPPPTDCPDGLASVDGSDPAGTSQQIPAEEADGLRFLPTQLPEGREIRRASAWRDPTGCPDDLVLAMRADGGDATVEASVHLRGPHDNPLTGLSYGDDQAAEPTEVRGVAATRITLPPPDGGPERPLVVLTWTEASGTTWALEGQGVDEATLRGVAEALVLDPATTAPANIAPGDVPDGFEVSWRASEPAAAGPQSTWWWIVGLGEGPDGCVIWVQTTGPGAAPARAYAVPGTEMLTVRGQEAVAHPDRWLEWQEPSGVRVQIACQADTEDLVRMAESLEPVTPDDPRLR